jgi:3-methyladenine DNA glycosylase/8-oxoguanine DNA glycosylase
MLRYLGPRAVPGAERVDGDVYARKVGGRWLEVRYDKRGSALALQSPQRADGAAIRARIARLFDPAHDATLPATVLRRSPVLRRRVAATPGLRPLGAWAPFELCVRTLVGQQVTVAAANTLMRRLAERCGGVTPERLAGAKLGGIGMPSRRVESLQRFAQAVADGAVGLEAGSWPDVDARLGELPGFGPWTRAYLAIRLGRDPDALPEADVGLMRAAGAASPRDLLRMAEAWRPYRAYAAAYLWLPE